MTREIQKYREAKNLWMCSCGMFIGAAISIVSWHIAALAAILTVVLAVWKIIRA